MSILSFSAHRELATWLVWLLVLINILLAPGSGLTDAVLGGYPIAIWQSAFDPVPWLGRYYRLGWVPEQPGGKFGSGSMSGNVGWHWQFACGAVITWLKLSRR